MRPGRGAPYIACLRASDGEGSAASTNAVLQAGIFQGTASLGDGVEAKSVDANVYDGFLVRWKK